MEILREWESGTEKAGGLYSVHPPVGLVIVRSPAGSSGRAGAGNSLHHRSGARPDAKLLVDMLQVLFRGSGTHTEKLSDSVLV